MKRIIEIGASTLAFTTVLALASGAQAQDTAPAAAPAAAPAPAPEPAPAPAPAQAQGGFAAGGGAQAGGGMTLPGAAPAQAVAGDSDHDQVIGTFGVGYLGMTGMDAGNPAVPVTAPIVGIRYWVDQMIGIDAGIGVGIHGQTFNNGADQPVPSTTAFLLHGGVPLSLASAGHFSFQVIPELNVGFASLSQDAPAGAPGGAGKISGSGFHFDVGARIGAEIHFGFIGIPKLSLQGSVGLRFQTENTKTDTTQGNGAITTQKGSHTDFGTTVQGNPWDIFRGNIAALYYF